jgi:hypothetical protein
MADPLLAQSAIDRLHSNAHDLIIDGAPYRRRQRPSLDDQPPAGPSSPPPNLTPQGGPIKPAGHTAGLRPDGVCVFSSRSIYVALGLALWFVGDVVQYGGVVLKVVRG